MTLVEVSEKAVATSPSQKRGSRSHLEKLQSKESDVEKTRNREDGKKTECKKVGQHWFRQRQENGMNP